MVLFQQFVIFGIVLDTPHSSLGSASSALAADTQRRQYWINIIMSSLSNPTGSNWADDEDYDPAVAEAARKAASSSEEVAPPETGDAPGAAATVAPVAGGMDEGAAAAGGVAGPGDESRDGVSP